MWAGAVALALVAEGPALAFRNVKEGDEAPGFSLQSAAGSAVSLADLKGKAVALAFVRVHHEKSEEALKSLSSLADSLGGRMAVLAVVVNPEEGDAAAWRMQLGLKIPVLVDSQAHVYGLYGVMVAPSTGIIDPEGKFRGEVDGYSASYTGEVEVRARLALGLTTEEELKEAARAEAGSAKSEARKEAERLLEKARLLAKRRMKDKALASALEAVKEDDTYAEAHQYTGELLLDASDENGDAALAHFERAQALEPRSVQAKVGIARVMSVKGQHDEAAAILERAAQLNPNPEVLYYHLGRVYERAGLLEKAVGAYRKALEKLLE